MADNTQAVVDAADTQPKVESEAEGARNNDGNLDTFLAEFDKEVEKPVIPPPVVADIPPDFKALAAEVQSLKGVVNEVSQFKFRRDMDSLVKDIRGDLDPEVFDDGIVEAWIDAAARKDPRLQAAWLERETKPKLFRSITAELGKAFKKKWDRLPDRNATEDRDAVTAAIRGASTKAPEDAPSNFGNMSNSEYRKEVREKFGFDPGV